MPFLIPINSAKSEKISGCANSRIKTLILLDKIVLSLPAGNFLTRSFSILALFSFFHLEQLGFLITGWPLTYSEILKMRKKFSTFLTIPPKDMKIIQVQFFFPDDQTLQACKQTLK